MSGHDQNTGSMNHPETDAIGKEAMANPTPRNGGGWIKAWRKLDTNTTLQEADTRGVFLTLLLRATMKPTKVFVRRIGKHITLDEGQCYASIRDLTKLKISAKRVRTILKNLENGHIISTTKGQGITVITILNFKHYQERPSAAGTGKGTGNGTHGAHMGHTEQEGEEGKEGIPVGAEPADGVSVVPLVNPAAVIFTQCLAVLKAGGVQENHARSLLGKWRKSHGDAAVIEIVGAASEKAVSEPVPWIEAALKQRGGNRGGGMRVGAI